MPSTQQLLVHVGYPKTGTTTLQMGIFEQLQEVYFVGKRAQRGADIFRQDWASPFRDVVNYAGDFQAGAAAPELSEAIQETFGVIEQDRILVSLEGVTNPLVDTRYLLLKDAYRKAAHLQQILAPLRDSGTQVKIFIGLRDHKALIPSLFSQIYLQGFASGLYGPSYDDFLDFLFDDPLIGMGASFYFDQILDHYIHLFGQENVFAADMKGLFSAQACRDTEALAAFLGIPVQACIDAIGEKKMNVRLERGGAQVGRRMMTHSPAARQFTKTTGVNIMAAAFSVTDRLNLRRKRPVLWQIPDASDRIDGFFHASNDRLRAVHGIET